MIGEGLQPLKKVWIPKTRMQLPPPGFEASSLGELNGAIRQYRGPDGLHLREYRDRWELHRDLGDPRTVGGLIIHMFLDAPEVGIALLLAAKAFKETYDKSRSLLDAVGAAAGTGVLSYISTKALKELLQHVS